MSMNAGPQWEPTEPAQPAPPSGPKPLRMGQVVEIGLRILRRHWAVMLLLAMLFAGPGALLTSVTGMHFTEVAFDLFPEIDEGTIDMGMVITQAELDRALDALMPYLAATVVAGLLASIGALAFSAVVADDYHARTPDLGRVLRATLRRTPSALVFMLVTSLIVIGLAISGLLAMSLATLAFSTASFGAGGPGVFLALVVGVGLVVALVYLTMRWAPAYPAMIEEDIGWRAALRRSWHLSGDNVWRIFVISLFAAVIVAIVGSLLSQAAGLALVGWLAPTLGLDERVAQAISVALGSLLLAPLPPVLTAVLFFDLRARRDVPTPEPASPTPYA